MNPPPPSTAKEEDEFPDTDLSPLERKRLRLLMEKEKRARWFWTTLRTWVIWIGGVAIAVTTSYQWIKEAVRALAR